MKAMHCSAKVAAKAIATAFDLTSYKTACDLGGMNTIDHTCFFVNHWFSHDRFALPGCTGVMAYEFIKAHPELSVTVFDLPAVVDMREYFHPQSTDSRVSFKTGQFLFNCSDDESLIVLLIRHSEIVIWKMFLVFFNRRLF